MVNQTNTWAQANTDNKNNWLPFVWTDELLELTFGKGKLVGSSNGVILYEAQNMIYVVDEVANKYYWETDTIFRKDWYDKQCKPTIWKWVIEMIDIHNRTLNKLIFTIWKWTRIQKVEDYLQKQLSAVSEIQKQTRIRASLEEITWSWLVIPTSVDNVSIQWEEMQYIRQIYTMSVKVGWMNTTIEELLVQIDQKPDNAIALRNTITFLKKTEPFSHFPSIFEYFEVIIQDKVNQVELTRWHTRIEEIKVLIADDALTISTLFSLSREVSTWIDVRAKNPLPTGEKEREASVLLDTIQKRIEEMKVSAKEWVIQSFEAYEKEIGLYLSDILYVEHIPQIYNELSYKWAVELTELLPTDTAVEKRWVLARLINDRRNILEREKEGKSKKLAEARLAILRDIRSNLVELSDLVKVLENEGDILSAKRENGLVKTTENLIWQLAAEEAEKIHKELMNIFDERLASLRLTESVFQRSGGKIDLWDESFASVFEPENTGLLTWELIGKKSENEIIISFRNSVGGTIEPTVVKQYRMKNPLAVSKKEFAELQEYLRKWNTRYKTEFFDALQAMNKTKLALALNPDDFTQKDNFAKVSEHYDLLARKSYLARMFHHLPKNNLSARPLVPQLYPGTIIWPTTESFLQNFSDLAEKQIESQGKWSGIIIIEGDAGTGKNFKIDIYAHMTNREVFEMQGNKTAQKEDILYSYELWTEGTYRLPSHLIRGIQTPWAVIVLDEMNTYPPEVLKLLNPLLDGRRYINDPQFGKITVHKSVLLVGLMNPQHYLATTALSPEVKSRARMMKDSYPAFKLPDGTISWEEAFLITRHIARIEPIKKMDQNTFISFWNTSVNQIDTWFKPTDKVLKILDDVAGYLAFANSMRWIYQKTMMWNGNEEFHYPIGLREGVQVIEEYERNGFNMQQAVRDVIIPKISWKNVDVWAETKLLETGILKI